jgi:hypothetical protein
MVLRTIVHGAGHSSTGIPVTLWPSSSTRGTEDDNQAIEISPYNPPYKYKNWNFYFCMGKAVLSARTILFGEVPNNSHRSNPSSTITYSRIAGRNGWNIQLQLVLSVCSIESHRNFYVEPDFT